MSFPETVSDSLCRNSLVMQTECCSSCPGGWYELQSGRDPDEYDEHADELPWNGFWQFVQKFFGYANRVLQKLSGWLVRTAVRSRPRWVQRACRWASLRRFLTVCAEILWLCKPIVAAAVRVAGLRRSWRWRCWMWRSWAGVVTCGLRLWGRLDVLPNSLKHLWRRLMVEKWTFNSRATALVDIPAVSMPIARSLKTCDICGIVLCDKTAHIRVAFYCGQPKAHLCNNHAV